MIITLASVASVDVYAGAPAFAAELGYSHLLEVGDADLDPVSMHGGGINFFGGYDFGFGLVPEAQAGVFVLGSHRRSVGFEVDTVWTVTPLLLGARYRHAFAHTPVRPFAAAHLGVVYQHWVRELLGVRGSGSTTQLAFNLGVGGEWMLTTHLGLGAAVWYLMIVSLNDEVEGAGHGHLLSAGAHVSFTL